MYIVNSFTFFHWRILFEKRLYIEDFSQDLLEELCFTQLPNGDTLLHIIRQDFDALKRLFEIFEEL